MQGRDCSREGRLREETRMDCPKLPNLLRLQEMRLPVMSSELPTSSAHHCSIGVVRSLRKSRKGEKQSRFNGQAD